MEVFDLYDKEGNLLNKTMKRGSTNLPGEYHLVVHIWIKRSDGKYLIQQRNKVDDRILHQWAATGGAVTAGEDSITGALRETHEELGILFKKEDFILLKRFHSEHKIANYITDLYIIKEDVLIKDLNIDKVEVKQCQYYTMEEIKKLVRENKAWNYELLVSRVGYYEALEKS